MRAKIRTTIVCREKCVSILIERKRVVIIFRLDNSDLIGKNGCMIFVPAHKRTDVKLEPQAPRDLLFRLLRVPKLFWAVIIVNGTKGCGYDCPASFTIEVTPATDNET